jgi:hypothetical protein
MASKYELCYMSFSCSSWVTLNMRTSNQAKPKVLTSGDTVELSQSTLKSVYNHMNEGKGVNKVHSALLICRGIFMCSATFQLYIDFITCCIYRGVQKSIIPFVVICRY